MVKGLKHVGVKSLPVNLLVPASMNNTHGRSKVTKLEEESGIF